MIPGCHSLLVFPQQFLPTNVFASLIACFLTPKIDYCNSLLYGLPDCELNRLQSVLNAAARLVFGARRRDHITPLIFRLHWLKVRERIEYKHSLLAFKSMSQLAPGYLQEFFVPTASRKLQVSLRSNSKNLMTTPVTLYQNISWIQVIFSVWSTDLE